jgi:protein gp37
MGADKYQHDGDPRTSGLGFGISIHPDALGLPYTWRTPWLVFVNSMSDLSVGVWTGTITVTAGS